MERCKCTISKDNVEKRCPHQAIYPIYDPKYCGKHIKSKTRQIYVRSPSPQRRRK